MKKEANYARQRLIMKIGLVVFILAIAIGTPVYYMYESERSSFALNYVTKYVKDGKSTLANKSEAELKSEGFIDADQEFRIDDKIVTRLMDFASRDKDGFRFYKKDPELGLITIEFARNGRKSEPVLMNVTAINYPKIDGNTKIDVNKQRLIHGTNQQVKFYDDGNIGYEYMADRKIKFKVRIEYIREDGTRDDAVVADVLTILSASP